MLALILLFGALTTVSAQSWPNGYAYKRTITLSHAKVSNSDQTNFPVLIAGTYSYLATTRYGGNVTNSNGYDIIFTSDAAGSNMLAFERQSYSASTGAVTFWVNVPTLSHTTDTVIYMFYGNSSVTTDQSNKTAVWNSNYLGVWHMSSGANGVTLNANDSTANGNNGSVNSATAVSGIIADAASFGSSSDVTTSLQAQSGQLTYEIWAYASGGGGDNFGRMFDTVNSGTGGEDLLSYNAGAGTYQYQYTFDTTNGVYGITAPSLNAWHFVVVTYNTATPGTPATMYLDGVAQSLASRQDGSGNPVNSSAGQYVIGNRSNDLARNWGGYLEEFRLSNTTRSADWIATEYNSESSPSTFYTIGSGSGGGGGSSPSISSLSPTSGAIGTSVTITGANFGSSQGSSTVTFNGTAATPASWNPTSIVSSVPSGATTGNVVVTVGGTASNGTSFTVTTLSVSVSPQNVTLAANQTQQFSATVSGTSNQAVTWSISPGVGSVSSTGLYTAPSTISSGQTLTVIATSQADTTKSGSGAVTLNTGVYYYFEDELESSRVITDSSGNVCYDADFYPFGGERPVIENCPQNYKFTGKERDSESGLDNFETRYFSSQMGRFTSPGEPLVGQYVSEPQSWNMYSYVGNNPTNATDPDGQDCVYVNDDSVDVKRGDCYSDTDKGIFVNGTINTNSFTYNSQNQSLGFNYTNDDTGALGSGVIAGVAPSGGVSSSDLFNAVAQGTQMAAPGVNLAANGLQAFGWIAAPELMALAQCGAAGGGCSVGGTALALIPGLGDLKGLGIAAHEEKAIGGVLKQIADGTTKGKEFLNATGNLPAKAAGYYREFTVPLAGQSGRGAARIVTGAGGEIYYTADHYLTFTRLK